MEYSSVRIDKNTIQLMQDYKKKTGMSMAFLIRQAVKQFIKNNPPEN